MGRRVVCWVVYVGKIARFFMHTAQKHFSSRFFYSKNAEMKGIFIVNNLYLITGFSRRLWSEKRIKSAKTLRLALIFPLSIQHKNDKFEFFTPAGRFEDSAWKILFFDEC